jgi:fucose permease
MYVGVFATGRRVAGWRTAASEPAFLDALRQLRSPGAVLFALLLFFQFGNEWSLAAWLPLFVVRRLGTSPSQGLNLAALYWLALLAGRLAAVFVVGRVKGRKLLPASALAAIFGLAVLSFTDNLFGAATAVVCVGLGHACIFPLVLEKLGRRFPDYHPTVFNGIFSFALMGAMLAPGTLGFLAKLAGIGVVMALPLAGMGMVLLLLVLIWLEAKVSGR